MPELIQQFSVPAKTTIAREFPESDVWSEDPFLIKFGDFEVQVMDKNMETIMVFLDDHLFVDGKLVKESPGDSFPSNKNNHHSITADEPLPSTTTVDGYLIDQGQDLQEHAHSPYVTIADDMRKSVSQCNQTIADLVDKKLLKFTKSKRGFFKKQTTTFSRERDEVLETLHRLSEQSSQVAQNEVNLKRQLGIKQRNQVILERIIGSFGKEVQSTNSQILKLNNQLESTNSKCQELKENIKENKSRWAEELSQKDRECQKIRKGEALMAQLVKEKDQTLDYVAKELSNAKGQVKLLEATNGNLETEKIVLLRTMTEQKDMHQKVAEAKEILCGEKRSLESGIKMMEARMGAQRQLHEDQMNRVKESYEMEIKQMKKLWDAEMVKRDELFQDLCKKLTKETNRHETLKRETDVIRSRIEEMEKQNETLKNETKLVKESLYLVTDERAKLISSHQDQVDHLHYEIKILKGKLIDEQRCRAIVADLHQRLIVTKKAEEDRFTVRQVELFLTSCTDNAVLLDKSTQIQKKHIEQAAESHRRCDHLQQNNKQLQKKIREANERFSTLYRDFEKLQGKLVDAERKIASRGALKDRRSIPNTKQIHPMSRIKELECDLLQKVNEQEDMRVLIRWLKKDLTKAEKDLAQVTSEKQDLIVRMEKERTDHIGVVNNLQKIFAQEKLDEKNLYEMKERNNIMLAKNMTERHRQLKIRYENLQKSKIEADDEVERLKDCVSEMEDELDEMDEELDNCEQDIEELEDDLDDAEKNLYEIRERNNIMLAKNMTELHRQLKISYENLQKSKIEADDEVERLKDCVSEMEDELDEMDEELDNREQDIEELEDDLDDAEYDIDQKEKQIRKLKTQVEELLKTKNKLEKNLRSFQSRIEADETRNVDGYQQPKTITSAQEHCPEALNNPAKLTTNSQQTAANVDKSCKPQGSLLTDNEIATGLLYRPKGPRRLVKWENCDDDKNDDLKLDEGTGWDLNDMYSTNAEKYNYKTTLDDDLSEYTTVLVREDTEEDRLRWERACHLADEIQRRRGRYQNYSKQRN